MYKVEFDYGPGEIVDFVLGDSPPRRVLVVECMVGQKGEIHYRICWFGTTGAVNTCSCYDMELRKVPKPDPAAD